MNILLYTPPVPKQSVRMDYLISCEPLELEYLYTVLEAEHSVAIMEKGKEKKLTKQIDSRNVKMLCISCYITQVTYVLLLVEKLKKEFPELYIVVGGVHAEVVPEHFFSPFIDAVVFGNHLTAIQEIAQGVSKNEPPENVEGAAFKINGFKIQTQQSFTNNIPIPKRIQFEANPEKYYYFYLNACATVKTAFGCPGKCSFCFCRKMNDGKYSTRPIEQVVDEIEQLTAQNIFIVDDNFLTSKKRLETFCDELERRKIHKNYITYGTSEFISANPDLIARLKLNGLTALIVGFEYITESALHSVNKKATVADNDATIAVCRNLNIDLFALFICDPDWKHAEFIRLAKYVRKNKIPFATYSTPTVLPNTDEAIQQKTQFDTARLWSYDLLHLHQKPKNISAFSYYLWLYFLYLIPATRFSSLKHLLTRYGFWNGMKLLFNSTMNGALYFLKLLIYK